MTGGRPPGDERPAQVDDLRQRLRQLGYLDAGLDRFVLASAHHGQGASRVALLASLRIGLLGGLLLGPAAAVGITARLPGLATGPRDVLVLAVYAAVLFGMAIAALAGGASLLVARLAQRASHALARRGRGLSIAAGVGVGVLTLTYLSMLWTTITVLWGPGGAHGTLWLVAGFAVAAAVSLLLGHAVTLTALAVVVAGTGMPLAVAGVPGASWRVLLGLGAVGFGGALSVFTLMAPGRSTPAPPALTVVPSGYRVRVIAIDGVDPGLFAREAAAGRLPALAAALGGETADLHFDDPGGAGGTYDPARLWTTIATGQPAAVHGVESLETRRVAGISGRISGHTGSGWADVRTALDLLRLTRPAVASGTERRVKTFWEVAADAGLRTAVVNWWATWPASNGPGIVLSDRATLRLEHGGALDAEIAPAATYDQLAPRWPALRAEATALAQAAAAGPAADGDDVLQRSARLDAMTRVLTGAVTLPDTDLVVSYYAGPDVVRHAVSQDGPADANALARYYVVLDRLLGPVLAPGDGELVVVVTAPGRVEGGATGRVAVLGTAARRSATDGLQARDLAPTILYALGLPVSRELPGRVATPLLAASFVARYPVRFVPEYGRPDAARAASAGQPLEQEMIDRLRSLGYVK